MNFNDYYRSNPLSELEIYSDNRGIDSIKELEARYSLENEMIRAVSQGNYKALSKMVTAQQFSKSIEKRVDDPIRNMKNFMIIMNTLMRKGVEVGNVHPFYIHEMSSDFAIKIEACRTNNDIERLWDEMVYSYCRLVKNHAQKGYSPLVQNVIMLIDADITADLSLKAMSERFNVNASYLSSAFKKDTKKTLTQYVTTKRVEKAMLMLRTTSLQVQQISHECGLLDVNYFTKIFKKNTGCTPKEYRENNRLK